MDDSVRIAKVKGMAAAGTLLAVLAMALAACGGGGGEQQIYPVGTFTIARDDFLEPGTYEVEDVGEYACITAVFHGPNDGDLSDYVHVYGDEVIDFGDGSGTELRIQDRDEVLIVQNDRCKLIRKGD